MPGISYRQSIDTDIENVMTARTKSNEHSPVLKEPDTKKLLQFAIESGILDLDSVKNEMNKKRLKELIKNHPYSIYQGKDGRWRTYLPDTSNKYGRKLIVKSSEDALYKMLGEYYESMDESKQIESITLRNLYPRWLEYKKVHTNAATYISRIETDWKKYYLNNKIIDIPIKKLDKLILDEFVHRLIQDNNMTKNQYFNVTVIIRQALLYAVDLGIIESSPLALVKVDGKRMFRKVLKKPDETQVFSKEELEKITACAWQDFQTTKSKYPLTPLAVLFQLQTGTRIGEICVLRYSDIERKDYIHIQRMLRRDTGEVINHTKTEYGDRMVPLTNTAKKIIEAVKDKQTELHVSTNGYIFSTTPEPLPEHAIAHLYTKYCKQTGCIHKSSHKARKTYISALIDANLNINSIRKIVGHSDERTTLGNYCFDRRSESEKRQKIEEALLM